MATLTPSPKMQFFTANGVPLSGGKLYTFSAGTTTPLATYTDSTGSVPNANPVVLNARGEASVWLGTSLYYMELKDASDVLIWSSDNIGGVATLSALAASGGSSLVGFIQAGTGAVAGTVQSKLRESVSVFDFMTAAQITDIQSRTTTLDVTAAIQTAINFAITSNGGRLKFPAGTYKITSALIIPFSTGWVIEGDSMLGTTIVQDTDNTPIFKFTSDLTHSFVIREFKFDWTRQQASTNLGATGIYFIGGSVSAFNYFNFVLERLNFNNACVCIGADTTTKFSVWGMTTRNITLQLTVTRSFTKLVPTTSTGMPNNRYEHIYINATSMVGPIFDHSGQENAQMDNIEINQSNQSAIILNDISGGTYDVGSLKLEGGVYTATNPMFFLSNSTFVARRILLGGTLTYNAAIGLNPYIFRGGITNCHIDVNELSLNHTVSGGTLYIFFGIAGGTNTSEINRFVGSIPSGVQLTDLISTADANGTKVRSWMDQRISSDKGDADTTVVPGDPTTILYDTALTAPRTVTLPNVNASNSFNGLTYTVVRTANSTGASALTVSTKSLAAGQWVKVRYKRFSWLVVEFGSL